MVLVELEARLLGIVGLYMVRMKVRVIMMSDEYGCQ